MVTCVGALGTVNCKVEPVTELATLALMALLEIVTIFTSKPAGNELLELGDEVGTDARQIPLMLDLLNLRSDAVVTLFRVAVVVAKLVTCADGVLANSDPRGAT